MYITQNLFTDFGKICNDSTFNGLYDVLCRSYDPFGLHIEEFTPLLRQCFVFVVNFWITLRTTTPKPWSCQGVPLVRTKDEVYLSFSPTHATEYGQ